MAMIFDISELNRDRVGEYDVCIIGSGPAGLTVAHELVDTGIRICVLESGGRKPTKRGDRLRFVQSEGIAIKPYSRERVMGGTSTTWRGLTSPLDPIDLQRKNDKTRAWPISYEELQSYYQRASSRYHFPPTALFRQDTLGRLKEKGEISFTWDRLEEKVFAAKPEPLDFGMRFEHIFLQDGCDLYLDATVIRLECLSGHNVVGCSVVQSSRHSQYSVHARIFVLAAGGIENPRILLNSHDMCPKGLGNEHDQVGRYLMNHPKNHYGFLHLKHPVHFLPYYFGCIYQDHAIYAGIRLRESYQEQGGWLNSYVRFEPLFPWSDNQGVGALVFLVKRLRGILRRWLGLQREHVVVLRDYSETGDDSVFQDAKNSLMFWLLLTGMILVNIPTVTHYLYHRLISRRGPQVRTLRIRNFMEMIPHPGNRVTLGEETDEYGQRLPMVSHETTVSDRQSLIELHRVLGEEVLHSGLGEMSSSLEKETVWPVHEDASHHLGTTRMGMDSATSVVDANCRLHSVENVFATGGSVFPTSGCANPTYTIVALAIRLADYLKTHYYPTTKSPIDSDAREQAHDQ